MTKALARLAAGLGLLCAGLHLIMAWQGARADSLAPAVIGLGMAGACLPCVARLWQRPDAAVWRMTAVMAAAMLGLHRLFSGWDAVGHHAHGGGSVAVASAVLLALAAAVALTRPRSRVPWRLPSRAESGSGPGAG